MHLVTPPRTLRRLFAGSRHNTSGMRLLRGQVVVAGLCLVIVWLSHTPVTLKSRRELTEARIQALRMQLNANGLSAPADASPAHCAKVRHPLRLRVRCVCMHVCMSVRVRGAVRVFACFRHLVRRGCDALAADPVVARERRHVRRRTEAGAGRAVPQHANIAWRRRRRR